MTGTDSKSGFFILLFSKRKETLCCTTKEAKTDYDLVVQLFHGVSLKKFTHDI